MSKEKLVIFDTTLRDGEQSPGASMTKDEKIQIAKALERLKVDVIEAGFPIASPGDFESVKAVAETITDCTVAGLCRTHYEDIDRCAEALKPAKRGRIHVVIATSPLHMEKKLNMTPDEVVEQAVHAMKRARKYTDDVEFSAEDAGRSEIDFLCRIYEAVIDAGATTINFPDTVGYNLPELFGAKVREIIERVPNSDKAVFSTHCHNDLGMATANSLAAVMAGARQVEVAINGLGERAGNAALEEIVMAVRTRQDVFPCNVDLDISQIMHCSRLVSSITGFQVQPNKSVVGINAFAHESGIHQDGVLKHRETYEIMKAEDVGWKSNRIVLGKHSGRNAFRTRLEEIGIDLQSNAKLNILFRRFKELADKKHDIFDDDLYALASDVDLENENDRIKLLAIRVVAEMGEIPKSEITLELNGEEKSATAEGAGSVDATFKAIEKIVQSGAALEIYSVNSVTEGTDALGEATVRLMKEGRIVNGIGADTDIVIASAKAYVSALNNLGQVLEARRLHPGDVGSARP